MENEEARAKMAIIPKMGQDFFKYLPSEIISNILLRLPIRSTMSCKCVCKPWLDLLTTPEFIKSRVSNSAPCFAVCQDLNNKLCVYDDLGLEQPASPCPTFFDFNVPVYKVIRCSVNGLIFLENYRYGADLLISNPITRECIALPAPPLLKPIFEVDNYGFGVSSITGQYKLVRTLTHSCPLTFQRLFQSECQVHTLGTGLWRSIGSAGPFRYGFRDIGVFLNGNLHFMVCDSEIVKWISCFDLETESFSTFSAPSLNYYYHRNISSPLCVLKDCLCICHNCAEDEIVIWLLKDYGDGKSWTREFVISRTISPADLYGVLTPIKVFKNGDVLMAKDGFSKLLCYSDKTKTIQTIDLPGLYDYDLTKAIIFSPSFISLKQFSMENVSGVIV